MQSDHDTIAAISTAVGPGGIGVVRISGPNSIKYADAIFSARNGVQLSHAQSHLMLYGHIIDPSDRHIVDDVLTVVMRAPHSYTREDVVEISCHGGFMASRKILELILSEGARHADPGEFTKRAFLNGRLSLSQAEAVLDIINAKTETGMRIAAEQLRGSISEKLSNIRMKLLDAAASVEAYIDFPEEDIEASTKKEILNILSEEINELHSIAVTFEESKFFRDGLSAAIVGKPNVGKSSLLNALLKKDRAIVTEMPGTTRDIIEEYLNIRGLPVRIIDTAGIRNTDEMIEQAGIRRSKETIEHADLVIAMFDSSRPIEAEDRQLLQMLKDKSCIFVLNKADLASVFIAEDLSVDMRRMIRISTVNEEGIEDLKNMIFELTINKGYHGSDGVIITNIRHKNAIDRAIFALKRAKELLLDDKPIELFSIEIRTALDSIGEITGVVTTDELLDRIFNKFCIGK